MNINNGRFSPVGVRSTSMAGCFDKDCNLGNLSLHFFFFFFLGIRKRRGAHTGADTQVEVASVS